ncbi:serine/threonine-protein kinase [Fodinibius salsisoli]|uniref:Serine/threonine protein kinase n=1 Tax=Fodinibius salsisoli TaxID=2820877 RepID=A0ABT3PTL8_9BACT|nr:serine/threonine-protein kinase [Fodinibius salsisoli]MCW9709205.1 serine/threonine protein kinase [Fodinibius salsisoli]
MVKATNKLVSTEVEFEKLDPIGNGQGANSDVYKIRDVQLDTMRAVKQIETSKFSDIDEYFSEAQKMHKSAHPNVVPVHFAGIGTDNSKDYVYTVMNYYPKGSLSGLHEQRPLTVEEIIRFSLQFLTGIAYIHSKGILHFDIKPSNVLLKNDGVAAVTDFGIAEWLHSSTVTEPEFYLPHVTPERITTTQQSELTDIYHAGLTLYRLCNMPQEWEEQLRVAKNQRPDPDQSLAHAVIDGRFPDLDTFLPHIPQKLREVIRKATAIHPDDRYNTIREMMNELGTVKRYLKWQMKPSGSDTGHEAWEMKDSNGRDFRIQICENGSDWSIETTKTVNTTQKILACCTDGIDSHQKALKRVQTFIRSQDIGVT